MSDAMAAIEMPRYQSKKKVWALEVASIEGNTLVFADVRYAPRTVDDAVLVRYRPVPGDFYVQYDDGYESISPRKPFVEGYDKI